MTRSDRRAHADFEARREAAQTPAEPRCCCDGILSSHCGASTHPGAPCEDCGSGLMVIVHRGSHCRACGSLRCECGVKAQPGQVLALCPECMALEDCRPDECDHGEVA